MNYCMAILFSSLLSFAVNPLAYCSYVPSLHAHYALHDENTHAFWIVLAWDFDDFGAEPLLNGIEIKRLERETHLLMQQRHEIDDANCE